MNPRENSRRTRSRLRLGLLPLLLLGAPSVAAPALAQTQPRQPSAAELLRRIERLSVVGNVLYVAAHPDDENTRLLSYLGGEKLLRTAYLSLTRGDGGQNLIGVEQGPLLGLIRTQELLAARRIDGAEQYFTRARDFGYSKTPAETLSIWNKDAVLADLVLVIRRFRPDVIITRFQPLGLQATETHGHHTASAILTQEAFRAAADPKFHPEQLAFAGVWQAQRLYWNRSLWGGPPSREVLALPKLDTGVYNPVLGVSYGELAADSRSMHKSQGFGAAKSRGPSPEYFQPLLSSGGGKNGNEAAQSAPGAGIFDGLDLTWARVPGGARLAQLLLQAKKEFDPRRPEASVPLLLVARAELAQLPDSPWRTPKLRELDEVVLACAGLWVEANAEGYAVGPGGPLALTLTAINRSTAALSLREVRLTGGTKLSVGRELKPNEPVQLEQALSVPATAAISNPYWLAEAPEPGLFSVADPQLIGQPESPPALAAEFVLSVRTPAGAPDKPGATAESELVVARPVTYKWTDPVAGERTRAIEITPPVMVNPEAPVLMFPDAQPRPLRVRIKAGPGPVAGTVQLEVPAGFTAEPASVPFKLDDKGAETEVGFTLRPASPGAKAAAPTLTGTLRVVARVGDKAYSRGVVRIDHSHIPIQTLFPEAQVTLCRFDLKKTRARIGYIPGAGDEVPAALRQVGFEVTLLDDEALMHQPLARFGAILVGVRAFNTNPRLPFYHQRLMDYVAGGGNLIVQYNTSNRLGKLTTPLGPYPFEISQERVTDENAAVVFEQPAHPALLRPNRITAADFTGWVQERGLYFADKWSAEYQPLLSMHDGDEPPRRGSLLVARHGKGAFVYTGLAFFRQLPAGVPGAYRLLANLISYAP